MWPFTPNKPEKVPDLRIEEIQKLRDFRKIGEKFNYCGIEMMVEDIYFQAIAPAVPATPRMTAVYKNCHGDLKHENFRARDLIALKKENPK